MESESSMIFSWADADFRFFAFHVALGAVMQRVWSLEFNGDSFPNAFLANKEGFRVISVGNALAVLVVIAVIYTKQDISKWWIVLSFVEILIGIAIPWRLLRD